MPDPLLDAKKVAARLDVSLRVARDLMLEMHPVNVGNGSKRKVLRVSAAELERWIRNRTVEPDYGRLEIIKPPKRKTKRMDYAALGLTPDGKIPYRKAAR